MPRIDPAERARTLRALADDLGAEARRAHGGDHPLRGAVRFDGGTYRLSHLGVTASCTTSVAGALRAWCDAARRRAKALDALAPEPPRLPQVARTTP